MAYTLDLTMRQYKTLAKEYLYNKPMWRTEDDSF